MELKLKKNNLINWSWHSIISTYRDYGKQLQDYAEVKKRFENNGVKIEVNINNPDMQNIFALRFQRDVRNIDRQINVLDREIARRNNLIGVI